MEFDPREWGRLAQAAAVVWALLQLPRLATINTGAGLFGALLGTAFGVIVFGGMIRAGVLYAVETVRSEHSDA